MSLIPKKGTVYVVDDDEAVRDSLQWLLEGKDYRVRCFESAESFLSRYDPREVACLIVDIRMGGMTGLELQDRLIERKSPLPIVFITGHGDVPMAVNTMKKGRDGLHPEALQGRRAGRPGRAHAGPRQGRVR
jgi:FixJ family two-component response regulator